jgi:hypothetical protein
MAVYGPTHHDSAHVGAKVKVNCCQKTTLTASAKMLMMLPAVNLVKDFERAHGLRTLKAPRRLPHPCRLCKSLKPPALFELRGGQSDTRVAVRAHSTCRCTHVLGTDVGAV